MDHVYELPDLDAPTNVVIEIVIVLSVFQVNMVGLKTVLVPLVALLDGDGEDVLRLGLGVVLDEPAED